MVFIGLGNPGKEYISTRHNVGFMFVDEIAKAYRIDFTLNKKFMAEIAKIDTPLGSHYLLKPITYMNLSGNAVKAFVDYYKIDIKDLVVVYDDLDLPTGCLRIRKSGSAGGHKGMFSIISQMQTGEINRIRIGINRNDEIPVVNYVLSKFSKTEKTILDTTLQKAYNIFVDMEKLGIDYVMNYYNGVKE